MRVHRIAAVAAAAIVVGAFTPACSGRTIPVGGLELLLGTNLRVPADFDSMRLEVSQQQEGGGWNQLWAKDYLIPQELTLPSTFGIAAGSSADQVVLVRLIALKGTQPVVLREAEVQVPSDHVAELKMVLAVSCYGQVQVGNDGVPQPRCPDPATQSCQPDTGHCGPTVIDPTTLPPYTPGDTLDAGPADGTVGSGETGGDSSSDVTLQDVAAPMDDSSAGVSDSGSDSSNESSSPLPDGGDAADSADDGGGRPPIAVCAGPGSEGPTSTLDFTNNLIASPAPPGGLTPQNAPQIVVFGWDNIESQQGMAFVDQLLGTVTNPTPARSERTSIRTPATRNLRSTSVETAAWSMREAK